MQLLNRPQLLFLDEPTSGLDSVTALDLLRTFHSLAHGKSPDKAVTIVCSIHQPQSKIFNLFDSLILLKAGEIIYQGQRKQAMVRNYYTSRISPPPSLPWQPGLKADRCILGIPRIG
jgi:ATP-binding cassette subfamily G (WHITE) protein 2